MIGNPSEASGTIRVVLAEDGVLAREGITRLLARAEDIELVATCEDVAEARAAVERERPDVLLTDIRMAPTFTDEGIRIAAELSSSHPEIGVLVLSQHAEPLYAMTLFEQGSEGRGYMLKERLKDEGELSRALRDVAAGGAIVDPHIVDLLLSAQERQVTSFLDRLTPREREILGLVAEGRSNSAIAESLGITKRGVERHINSIFGKLELGASEEVSRRVKATLAYLAGQHD
jgi:DNA-binding NarL/FixJ family response regulator